MHQLNEFKLSAMTDLYSHTQSQGCSSRALAASRPPLARWPACSCLSRCYLYRTPWSSQHRGPWQWGTDDQWPLVATSLNPNHSWMHGRMALNDRAAPSVTVLW